jgi:16S rRNA (guanine1207-N2)-methyltransferase
MEQYFTGKPTSRHEERIVPVEWHGRRYAFATDSGVFSKGGLDTGTAVLLKQLAALEPGFAGHALDLGCGYGPLGVILSSEWPKSSFTLSDVNERAAALAARNLRAAGAANAKAVVSDGFASLEGPFDLVATNPPLRTGKAEVTRLMLESSEALAPGGRFYAVIRRSQGAESYLRILQGIFGNGEAVEKKSGYHVLRAVRHT